MTFLRRLALRLLRPVLDDYRAEQAARIRASVEGALPRLRAQAIADVRSLRAGQPARRG